jgi:hypothetical protein
MNVLSSCYPSFALAIGLVLFLSSAAMGDEAIDVLGGKDARKAVDARRGKTVLGKLAAEMKPGTWAELQTEMPKGLWMSPMVDGGRNQGGVGGLHIAGWTDDAHWDSRTGQFLYMGLRQTRQFIAYSEEKNAWRVIELDRLSDNPCFFSQFGHIYGSNGFDPVRSRFYHRYNGYKNEQRGLDLAGGISYFDTASEQWTKLPPVPPNSTFTGMAIEYFSALDGLVILGKNAWFFSNERQRWEELGPSPVDGYHSLFRHNPFRQEVLMIGGNAGPQVVARLKKDGKIERLKDFPFATGVHSGHVSIDPVTGRYLIVAHDKETKGPKQLFEFDSDKNEYRLIEAGSQWPFNRYAMPVVAFIPEHGVTMWAEQKVYLYKHDARK